MQPAQNVLGAKIWGDKIFDFRQTKYFVWDTASQTTK